MGKVVSENACLRRVVIAYNAFFWVTGPGTIGLGIWLVIALGEYEPVVDRAQFSIPAFLAIGAGGISVLAGLLGCLGGLSENRRLLVLYSVMMLTVFAAAVTTAVLCFLGYDEAEMKIGRMLDQTVQDYSANTNIVKTLDSIHKEFSCCGGNNYTDWLTSPLYASRVISSATSNNLVQVAPYSCCLSSSHHNSTSGGCNFGKASGVLEHPDSLYQTGCKPALVQWLRDIYFIAGWSTAGVAASMVLPLSAVCCLKHALSDYYS